MKYYPNLEYAKNYRAVSVILASALTLVEIIFNRLPNKVFGIYPNVSWLFYNKSGLTKTTKAPKYLLNITFDNL